jgi:two-component system, LytTR family, sensor histidine kinase AlgZ
VMPGKMISDSTIGDLFYISLFIQWIALTGTAILCFIRRQLIKLPKIRALIVSYLILLTTTFVVTELAILILWLTGKMTLLRPDWYYDLHILNLTISAIINGLMLRYFLAKHELKKRTLSEAQARLEALQSRIRPHFVFNSLNIIASLTRSEPKKAETAIEDMADLFRMMLSEDESMVPMKNEIDTAEKYLALERLRLDDRLQINWDIGKFPRKAIMPVLTLQPLLENAIRHGIEALPSGGTINVKLWEENDKINIYVDNPLPTRKSKDRESSRNMSLTNIRQRFQSYYGDAAKLEVGEKDNLFVVNMELPVRGDNA